MNKFCQFNQLCKWSHMGKKKVSIHTHTHTILIIHPCSCIFNFFFFPLKYPYTSWQKELNQTDDHRSTVAAHLGLTNLREQNAGQVIIPKCGPSSAVPEQGAATEPWPHLLSLRLWNAERLCRVLLWVRRHAVIVPEPKVKAGWPWKSQQAWGCILYCCRKTNWSCLIYLAVSELWPYRKIGHSEQFYGLQHLKN